MAKKILILHRYPPQDIKMTNASFPYLLKEGVEVKTFARFNRVDNLQKILKSLLWIIYAPWLVFLGCFEKVYYMDFGIPFPAIAFRRYDVIYADDSLPFYPLLVKLLFPKSKVVIRLGDLHLMYYCSGWVYKILHFIEKIEWRKVDKIIAISKSMKEYVEKESGRKVEIALDPIDPKDFEVENLKHRGGIVMFHGLLTKNKGIDMILEAAKIMEGINFVIIGDGPDYARLVKIAPKNVYMPGWIAFKEIKYHLQLCDVGIAIRSKNPGNEYVVTSPFLQYSVMAKPCVVSKRKVFDDMNYPYQFSNVDELVKQLRYLLDHKEVGLKWQKYVLENHNAQKVAEEIIKIWLA